MSIVLSCLACLATGDQLANASYPKPNPPIPPPPDTDSGATKAKVKVLKKMLVRVTAYYGPQPGQKKYVYGSYRKDVRVNGAGKITRSGKVPEIGTVASDWRVLPRETRLRIPDCPLVFGTDSPRPASEIIFTVYDTGGAVKGRHVDIFTGFGDEGRELAERFNDLANKLVIEVVEVCPPH